MHKARGIRVLRNGISGAGRSVENSRKTSTATQRKPDARRTSVAPPSQSASSRVSKWGHAASAPEDGPISFRTPNNASVSKWSRPAEADTSSYNMPMTRTGRSEVSPSSKNQVRPSTSQRLASWGNSARSVAHLDRALPPHVAREQSQNNATSWSEAASPRRPVVQGPSGQQDPPPLLSNFSREQRPSTTQIEDLAPFLFVPEPEEERQHRKRTKKHKSVGNALALLEEEDFLEAEEAAPQASTSAPIILKKPKLIEVRDTHKDVYIPKNISVANFARLLGVRHKRLQNTMRTSGMTVTNADYVLSSDDAYLLALEFDRNPIIDDEAAFDLYPAVVENTSELPLRPPVITIMGHVDHGKTTLLDTLRSTAVASGEAGGITQHIGAFSVAVPSLSTSSSSSSPLSEGAPRTITFLDTPGHAAFTAMRARGAGVTDIIVLVVAADDGVMPQTKEVIELAKKAISSEESYGVGLVIALNKIDKPGVDPAAIKHALLAEGVELEEFGGDVPCVEVSGLTGLGLDKLVETLSTLAEIKELRARIAGRAEGRVLESRVDKGRGAVATVLVTQGSLVSGAFIAAGTSWARVRQMIDSSGRIVRSVSAGMPVTVSGWKELPQAGDEVLEGKESEVKKAVQNRLRNQSLLALQADVQSINEKRLEAREIAKEAAAAAENASADDPHASESTESTTENVKELRLIIKGDVSGSIEAVAGAVGGIGNDIARVKIVQASVGEPTEADVDRAKAINGTILGFSVKASHKVLNYAAASGVPLHTDTVIYRLMDQVRSWVQALLPPIIEHRVLGEAVVQQMFEIQGKHKTIVRVAGCRVTNGAIERHKKVKVFRDGEEIYNGTLETLRQIKKDITEARKGSECGMSFSQFSLVQEGDKIQSFEIVEKPAQL